MNEQETYKTIIREQIVNDDSVKRYARTAAPEWKPALRILKPVAITLAALLIVFGVTMAIPSARAEVLGWFTPSSARDYIGTDPKDRESVPEIDGMIVDASQNRTEIKVNHAADEPYWREIGERFSATLGETFFDGRDIYLRIDFEGLSGYPLFENAWCPSLPADALLPTLLAAEDGTEPENQLTLTLEDGKELPAWIAPVARPVDDAFIRSFNERYDLHRSYDEKTAAAWREESLAHCKANGVRAVADVNIGNPDEYRFFPDNGKTLDDYIDENGYLTLHVRYWAALFSVDPECKLDVDLGTVQVNMRAYRDMKTHSAAIENGTVELSGEAEIHDWLFDLDPAHGVESCMVHLDGVRLEVINPGTVDILGMHDIRILVTMPDDWSEEQKNVFARNLLLDVRIDDDLAIDCGGGLRDNGDGSYTMLIDLSGSIPFDRIATMQRVTLTPALHATSYAESAIVLHVN